MTALRVIKMHQVPQNKKSTILSLSEKRIFVREMEENCESKGIELLYIRQISRAESELNSFHCVFMSGDEKKESREHWPERGIASLFYHSSS